MKKLGLLALGLAAAAAMSACSAQEAAEPGVSQEKYDALEAQAEELSAQLEENQAMIQTLTDQNSELQESVTALQAENAELQQSVTMLSAAAGVEDTAEPEPSGPVDTSVPVPGSPDSTPIGTVLCDTGGFTVTYQGLRRDEGYYYIDLQVTNGRGVPVIFATDTCFINNACLHGDFTFDEAIPPGETVTAPVSFTQHQWLEVAQDPTWIAQIYFYLRSSDSADGMRIGPASIHL